MSFLLGREGGDERRPGFGFSPATKPNASRERHLVQDPHEEGHWLCVAPTGTGKSASFVIPQLLSYPGSIIAVDVKGELCSVTSRYRRSLGEVVVFDPFGITPGIADSINPLGHIDPHGVGLVDEVYAIAHLFSPGAQGRRLEPFWDEWGQDIIAALAAYVLTSQDVPATLGEAYRVFHQEEARYKLAVLLDAKKFQGFAFEKIAQYLELPDITQGGVTATVSQQMRLLAGQSVQKSLGTDSFDLKRLEKGEVCTIYLVIPPDKLASHAALVKMVLSSLVQRLLSRRFKVKHPTMLLVDEASQLGSIPALLSAITLGRSFGVRTALLVQSLSQLRSAYGATTDAILENCSLMTMGKHTAFSMAKQLAEQGFGDVSAATLFSLGTKDAMVRIRGDYSRNLQKLDYRHDPLFKGRFDGNPFYDTHKQAAIFEKYCGHENKTPMQPTMDNLRYPPQPPKPPRRSQIRPRK